MELSDATEKILSDLIGILSQDQALTKMSKAIPLQALTGPEGSRSLRLPDFKAIGT